MTGTIIIGGGNAGFQVADSLKKMGYGDDITIICDEAHLPYQRPPLSKKYLEGEFEKERLFLRKQHYYDDRDISLKLGAKVVEVSADKKQVTCADGEKLNYEHLVFATGARVRKISNDDNILYLRTIDDVENIKKSISDKQNITLIGGGFIGLEIAATLTKIGKTVTVIEGRERILPDLVAPIISDYIAKKFKDAGVKINTGTGVSDVSALDADLVIVGIGVLPNIELAENCGIECDNGIVVDEFGRTNITNIFAAGDCAYGKNTWLGQSLRIESVQNAVDQATIVAANIMGENKAYDAVPWFWSDQFDMKLQMAGICKNYDDYIVRGNIDDDKFSICYFKDDKLIAIHSINSAPDHMAARKLLKARTPITPDQCKDTELKLKNHL